jgi:hypothetical protein
MPLDPRETSSSECDNITIEEEYYGTDDEYWEEEIIEEEEDAHDETIDEDEDVLEDYNKHGQDVAYNELYEEVTVGDESLFEEDDEEEEIVELSEEEIIEGSEDEKTDRYMDDSMCGSGDFDDSTALPGDWSISGPGYDSDTNHPFRRGTKKEDKIQMELHVSAINEGERKAMMEQVAREKALKEKESLQLERQNMQRQLLEQETAKFKSGLDSVKDTLGDSTLDQDHAAKAKLLNEIKRIDEVMSKRQDANAEVPPIGLVDPEKKKKALAELRRQVAREELARNNDRLKAVKTSGQDLSQSTHFLPSNQLSLISPGPPSPSGSAPGKLGYFFTDKEQKAALDLDDVNSSEYKAQQTSLSNNDNIRNSQLETYVIDILDHSPTQENSVTFQDIPSSSMILPAIIGDSRPRPSGEGKEESAKPHVKQYTAQTNCVSDPTFAVSTRSDVKEDIGCPLRNTTEKTEIADKTALKSTDDDAGHSNSPSNMSNQCEISKSTASFDSDHPSTSKAVISASHVRDSVNEQEYLSSTAHSLISPRLQGFTRRSWRPKATPTQSLPLTDFNEKLGDGHMDSPHKELMQVSEGVSSTDSFTLQGTANSLKSPRLQGFTRRSWRPKALIQDLPLTDSNKQSSHGDKDEQLNSRQQSVDVRSPASTNKKFIDSDNFIPNVNKKNESPQQLAEATISTKKSSPSPTTKRDVAVLCADLVPVPSAPLGSTETLVGTPTQPSAESQIKALSSPTSTIRVSCHVVRSPLPSNVPSLFQVEPCVEPSKSVPKMNNHPPGISINDVSDNGMEYFSLEDLQEGKADGINMACREMYLSPTDFQKLFKMTKDEFSNLPKWKRDKAKRALKLF